MNNYINSYFLAAKLELIANINERFQYFCRSKLLEIFMIEYHKKLVYHLIQKL